MKSLDRTARRTSNRNTTVATPHAPCGCAAWPQNRNARPADTRDGLEQRRIQFRETIPRRRR